VGGPGRAGGEPLFELPSSVVVEDGDGAGVERDGAFAVVALGVALPDDDAVGDGDGLADGEPCPVEVDVVQRSASASARRRPVVAMRNHSGWSRSLVAAVVEEGDELARGSSSGRGRCVIGRVWPLGGLARSATLRGR
jgi:hypothetical protein